MREAATRTSGLALRSRVENQAFELLLLAWSSPVGASERHAADRMWLRNHRIETNHAVRPVPRHQEEGDSVRHTPPAQY